MSNTTPTIVKLASAFSGQHCSFPQQGGNITMGELQSLSMHLRAVIKSAASLVDTVEQIRIRAMCEATDEKKVHRETLPSKE